MSSPALRLARAHWAPLVALAVLTLLSALFAVAVPARTAAGYDRAGAAAVRGTDLRVVGTAAGPEAARPISSGAALETVTVDWQTLLPPSLRDVAGEPEGSVGTARMDVLGNAPRPRKLSLSHDPGALKRIRLVAGGIPYAEPGRLSGDVPIIVSKTYATAMGYKVGTRLALTEGSRPRAVQVRITGLYEPLNTADRYWQWGPRWSMLRPVPTLVSNGKEGVLTDVGTALMGAGGSVMLTRDPARQLTFTWRFPIRADNVDAEHAAAITADLDPFRAAVQGRPGLFPCKVETALDTRLKGYTARLHTARTVLGLALGGLAAVAAGVLLLAAGLIGERLRPVLATMRARGASLRQLAAPVFGLTAAAVVPSAGLGYAAGRLLDAGPPQPGSAYAVAALALTVVTVATALVWRERDAGLGVQKRDDIGSARPSRRRLVLDGLLIALAVIGVVLLRRRGPAAGTDPLVAAVPALLGAAVGVLVLRVYPYLMRAAGPVTRRRRGAVAFLGLARAARQNIVGALPLAVLLLAAAIAGFTATVDTGLRDGQVRASYAAVGGDARLAAGPVDEAALRRIRAVPGVTGVLPARIVETVSTATDPAPMTLVGVDLHAYRKLAPSVPDIPDSGVLMSPLAAETMGHGEVTLSRPGLTPIRVKPTRTIERFPGQETGSAFVVVPYKLIAAEKGFPSQVFVTGHDLDARKLSAAAGGGRRVELRRDVLRGMASDDMVTVVHDTFRNDAVLGGAFGLLAVLLVLVVGARARARTIAHLRTLGLSRRQSRALALVEIAPVLLCAVGAGWVLGLLLPEITGPVVDLRPYTGGYAVTAHVPDLPALLGLAGALLLAAAAAVAVDRVFDTDPGTVLRTGDS